MSPRRLDLTAAADAEEVMATIARGGPVSSEVLTRLKGLPTLLRASGIPAVLAFFAAKAGPASAASTGAAADAGRRQLWAAYRTVRHALVTQLTAELGWAPTPTDPPDFYARLAALPAADLARASRRLDTFAGWLRRLAEATDQAQTPAPTTPAGPDRG